MSARPGRRHFGEDHEEHVDERWMASYMDMVTVLMCMFIVLYAMSTVDENKFEQLRNSLATGFGATDVQAIDTAKGVVVPLDLADQEAEGFTDLELAQLEVDKLTALKEAMRAALAKQRLEYLVDFKFDERGLSVGLVGTETFFQGNRVDLSARAIQVLDAIAPPLATSKREISVEGHADRHGSTGIYPTDWELSSGRATQVLRRMVEHGGVPQEHIAAVGFGSARPVTARADPISMAKNRRVDVVVLSDQPDNIRKLIPGVVNGTATEPPTKAKKAVKADKPAPAKSSHG